MRYQLLKLLSFEGGGQTEYITFNYAALYVQLDVHITCNNMLFSVYIIVKTLNN